MRKIVGIVLFLFFAILVVVCIAEGCPTDKTTLAFVVAILIDRMMGHKEWEI